MFSTVLLYVSWLCIACCGASSVFLSSPGVQRVQLDRTAYFVWRLNRTLMAGSRSMILLTGGVTLFEYEKRDNNTWRVWHRHADYDVSDTEATDSQVTFRLRETTREDAGLQFKLAIDDLYLTDAPCDGYDISETVPTKVIPQCDDNAILVIDRSPTVPSITASVGQPLYEGQALALTCHARTRTLPGHYANQILYTWKQLFLNGSQQPVDPGHVSGATLVINGLKASTYGYTCTARERSSMPSSSPPFLLDVRPNEAFTVPVTITTKRRTSPAHTTLRITLAITSPFPAVTTETASHEMTYTPSWASSQEEEKPSINFVKYGLAPLLLVSILVVGLLCWKRLKRRSSSHDNKPCILTNPSMENGMCKENNIVRIDSKKSRYKPCPSTNQDTVSSEDENLYYSIPHGEDSSTCGVRELPPLPSGRPYDLARASVPEPPPPPTPEADTDMYLEPRLSNIANDRRTSDVDMFYGNPTQFIDPHLASQRADDEARNADESQSGSLSGAEQDRMIQHPLLEQPSPAKENSYLAMCSDETLEEVPSPMLDLDDNYQFTGNM